MWYIFGMGIDDGGSKINIVSQVISRVEKLIEKAGVSRLTQTELDWIRPAEIIDKSTLVHDVKNESEKIVDGSIIDATQIGMYASRIVARNLDHRAYPEIIVDKEIRDKCHNNLLPFKSADKPQDILGDNYYFWTTLYSSLELKDIVGGITTKVLDKYAAKIMSWSRRVLAGQAVISDHSAAVNAALKVSSSLSVLSK